MDATTPHQQTALLYTNPWPLLPKPFIVQAPMEDATDRVFRDVLAQLGAPDLWFTEFTKAEGIVKRSAQSFHRLSFDPNTQHPIVAQLWGTVPEEYYEAVLEVRKLGFDGVDINMGCPQHKITRHGACAALIKNPTLAREIISAVREASNCGLVDDAGQFAEQGGKVPSIAWSVKTRIGFKTVVTQEWIGLLLSEHPAALTIHARTADQQSEGEADWGQIALGVQLRDKISPATVIVGNGDVVDAEQAMDRITQSGCDGAMVGRGIFSNPLIFKAFRALRTQPETLVQIRDKHENFYFRSKKMGERIHWTLRHMEQHDAFWQGVRNYEITKKYYKIFINGDEEADELRAKLMETHRYEEARTLLKAALSALD